MEDPHRVVATLSKSKASLMLSNTDLCCLVAVVMRGKREGLVTYSEEFLLDAFEQVCEALDPGLERPRHSASYAVERLREQRMLARVDGLRLVSASEYTLTTLATAVVDFYLEDERLTQKSLTALTRTLIGNLTEAKQKALRATDDDAWQDGVITPLDVTVRDLIDGIERRQRGLDLAQEKTQQEIASLIADDWFDAIERAQALLEATTDTLQELAEVLTRDADVMRSLLDEMLDEADRQEHVLAQDAIMRVLEQIDRITAWGRARQNAWSNYYQYVQRYLREVVRLDPERALSHRLRGWIKNANQRSYQLVLASDATITRMRELESRIEKPAVSRPYVDRSSIERITSIDHHLDIEQLVAEALRHGATTLREVCDEVLAYYPPEKHFLFVGRIARACAAATSLEQTNASEWVELDVGIYIEDWSFSKG